MRKRNLEVTDFNYKIMNTLKLHLSLIGLFLLIGLLPKSSIGQTTIWTDDFETDKGWAFTGTVADGGFERGTPTGGGGSHGNPNPTSAYNGSNSIGTNLSGGYSNNMSDREASATSPTIDCSGYSDIKLNFQRWLNLERSIYDHGYVEVSTNGGANWNEIWSNSSTLQETSWSLQSITLPASAYNNANVKIRFALGSTDGGWTYSGWNIDNVEITGSQSGDFRSIASKTWGNDGTWERFDGTNWNTTSNDPGSSESCNTVTIRAGHTVTLNKNRPSGVYTIGDIIVNGTLRNRTVVNSLSITGSITGTGEVNMSRNSLAHNLTVGEDFKPGTFIAGSANLFLNGASNQNINSYTFNNLTVSNGGDKTILGNITVNGILNMSGTNINIGDNNLTIETTGSITGTYSATNMIATDGSGSFIKNGTTNTAFKMVYPLGTGTYYTPMEVTSLTSTGTGSISVRAVASIAPGPPPSLTIDLNKYWEITETGLTITDADIQFSYNNNEVGSGGTQSEYRPRWYNGGVWETPLGASAKGVNPISASGLTNINGVWTAQEEVIIKTYYSYQSGNWNTINTWTHDPGGTTQTAVDIPDNNDKVIIISGRTITLDSDIASTNLKLAIKDGGILNMSTYSFTADITDLTGQGVLKLSSTNFPTVSGFNTFIDINGGTIEYNTNITLPTQATYNNLTINTSGTITQTNNITLNGNLHIKQGTLQVNDATVQKLQLNINGNVTVDAGANFTVSSGRTTTTTNPNNITGGTAPFNDYYDTQSHRIVINGDFTNNGTVSFTSLAYPVYNALPTSGIATVYFRGATDNTLTCNGDTKFYNLVLDKGIDQTFKLTVYSTAYSNFKLYGANSAGGDGGGGNPNLKKALWIRTGTLELKGLTIIPSLTEGTGTETSPNSNYYVPTNGALLLNGSNVVVLSTVDNYQEVNAAYGLAGGNNATYGISNGTNKESLSFYGKIQVDNGYLSTRESGGIITTTTASGQFIVNGGTVDSKQIIGVGGSSFTQNGGTITLRGRFQRNTSTVASVPDIVNATINTTRSNADINTSKATLSISSANNVFATSGGTIKIHDVCGSMALAIDILSDTKNINVTDGTVELIPTAGNNPAVDYGFSVKSKAPFGNLLINRVSSSIQVQLNTHPLVLLGNLTLQSGVFDANNLNVSVGGNFTLNSGVSYAQGTNKTIFNGSGSQLFTINLASPLTINKLEVDKTVSEALSFAGSQTVINITDSLILINGDIDDNGNTINASSHIYNSGSFIGSGKLILLSESDKSIDGDGTGVFKNIELNKPTNGSITVSTTNNITINGELTFSGSATGYKSLNIQSNGLDFGASATITGTSTNRFIQTLGLAGDKGVTKVYSTTSSSFLFPMGAISTGHVLPEYTPTTIGFNNHPTTYGSITVIPIGQEHPNTTNKNRSLTYFWRVKSTGFTGVQSNSVIHKYVYSDNDLVTGGDVTEDGYLPAIFVSASNAWVKGVTTMITEATNSIDATISSIDGDYTAGDDTPDDPFGTVTVYYSRNGAGDDYWGDTDSWSTVGHAGATASRVPGVNDPVIIGAGHTILLNNSNTSTPNQDVRSCATLKIEAGGVLDIGFNPSCDFGMVQSHTNGNGILRIAGDYDSKTTFQFPNGDFSEFNSNIGTTELYTTNSTSGTTYWLPNGITEYGSLIISPSGGSNIMFPNNDVLIYGDLTTNGQNSESWFCPTWNSNYPTIPYARTAKTITIKGNFDLQGGALIWYGNYGLAQNFIVEGNLIVNANAGIQVYSNANNQSISIGGNLINNSPAPSGGVNGYTGCDFTDIPLTFFGDGNVSITNATGTPYTILDDVTVNKGNSQTTTLTIDIAGTFTTPTNNWLTLQNGTLKFERNSNFTISRGTPFTIPSTAGLYINSAGNDILIANRSVDNNDLYLGGKLTIINGNVYVGRRNGPNNNNDIEYTANGFSEIDIQNGSLTVNGQIRRNTSTTDGILKYNQSGGVVTINGNDNGSSAFTTNAKLEILNTGSEFNMSAGTLNITRGGGGGTYGDLYLRPESSSITGGDIIFTQGTNSSIENYILDANITLNNLTITGTNSRNATVKLLISPLSLNGNLTLTNTNSIFDVNTNFNIEVSLKGDFDNSGTYNHYNNNTIFNGGTQEVKGTTSTSFYNINVTPVTKLTLNNNVDILNNLSLSNGTLECQANTVSVKGNLINNATYTETSVGVILNGSSQQFISGNGTFGRLEIDNSNGVRLLNAVSLTKNLALTDGILDINKYLLTLGENSNIEGSSFGASKMITSDGVFSNVGITKVFGGSMSTPAVYTFPIGTAGNYTPATLNITSIGTTGSLRLNNINDKHPATIAPHNVLNYFWEVESTGISGFEGSLVFNYLEDDVVGTEASYISARLITSTNNWSKPGDNVDEANNTISFYYNAGTDNLSGEYTAGEDASIPNDIPEYTTTGTATNNWSDQNSWTQTAGDTYPCPAGGPNGFIVIIDHNLTTNIDNCSAYKTTINEKLIIDASTSGHNFGTVSGSGTLTLQNGSIPAGRFSSFLDCASNSTLEYTGTTDYTIIADLFDDLANVHFTGTGRRILPNKNLNICTKLLIDGATLDNSVNNKKLTIEGEFEKLSGSFIAGSGSNATVVFTGSSLQTIGGVKGDLIFNNLEIDNNSGLSINENGDIEVKANLLLTDGLINTSVTNVLTITNTSENCTFPAGGSSSSYINGPLVKKINQGDSFVFPIGKDSDLGNKLSLSSSQSGSILWKAEYFTPNSTYNSYTAPLSYVNSDEYWTTTASSGSQAIINIDWDTQSDLTPISTINGVSDMRVAKYNIGTTTWEELSSSASGNNSNGTVSTSTRVTIPTTGSYNFTTACINTVKPRAKLTPPGAICGNIGIPVTFSASPALNYLLSYSIDNVDQTPITVTSTPYTLPTTTAGAYKLTAFTYDNGDEAGVVDASIINAYDNPTVSIAGDDQSKCGATATPLDGNNPAIGSGLWTINSGAGGSFVAPTVYNTTFNGVNGNAYNLTWTITNGDCESSDPVDIVFPLLAAKPADFTTSSSSVCNQETGVVYTVPNDATVAYSWSYSGDVTINGSGNSVNLDFGSSATSQTLSVSASNACGSSASRTIAVTVNPLPIISLTNNDADNIICTGTQVIFTGNSSSGPAITNYDFQIDGTSKQSGGTATFSSSTLVQDNDVTVIATAAGNCTTTSNSITMSVADGIWTGNTDSDWFKPGNWACGIVPTAITDLIIPTGASPMPIINGVGARFKNIIIENSATLTTNGASNIDVYGNWTNDGDLIANTGSITFMGTSNITGSSNITFNNVLITVGKSLTSSSSSINVTGDLTNNGSFVSNGGAVAFTGNTAQTVLGNFDGANAFNNLTINNSAGVTLNSSNKAINGSLTLTNGLLISADLLTLGENATTNINAASGKVSSYIVGSLSKVILGDNNGEFFFPIGTTTSYKPVGVSNVSGGLNTWKALYNPALNENSIKASEEIVKVSKKESWTIVSAIGTANVTLSWDEYIDGKLYIHRDKLSSLRVAHLDNSSQWVSAGLASSTGASTDFGTITSSIATTFDGSKKSSTSGPEEFALASTTAEDHPLPINLLTFTARADDNNVELFWTTALEINNEYFEIQRSIDSKNFNTIGTVSGSGNSSIEVDYSFIDENPSKGTNYYRLVQYDYNGDYEIHKTIAIDWNGTITELNSDDINIYPNPYTAGKLILDLSKLEPYTSINLTIIDIRSKLIYKSSMLVPSNGEINIVPMTVDYLNQGIYFISVQTGNGVLTKKVIVN